LFFFYNGNRKTIAELYDIDLLKDFAKISLFIDRLLNGIILAGFSHFSRVPCMAFEKWGS
jgi:hypothetical protein